MTHALVFFFFLIFQLRQTSRHESRVSDLTRIFDIPLIHGKLAQFIFFLGKLSVKVENKYRHRLLEKFSIIRCIPGIEMTARAARIVFPDSVPVSWSARHEW